MADNKSTRSPHPDRPHLAATPAHLPDEGYRPAPGYDPGYDEVMSAHVARQLGTTFPRRPPPGTLEMEAALRWAGLCGPRRG